MEFIQLASDLSAPVGSPQLLFLSSDVSWEKNLRENGFKTESHVTDEPVLHRCKSGKLFMIQSSFSFEGNAVGNAESTSGKITGPWVQQMKRLIKDDGSYGLIFRIFECQLMLCTHQLKHSPLKHMHLIHLEEVGNTLKVAQ